MDDALVRLRSMHGAGRLPHALLFTGGVSGCNDGEQHETAVDYAVKLHLCETDSKNRVPCGECVSCSKISRRVHPDVVYVKGLMPDGSYKIKQLREVIDSGCLRPHDRAKVYVFEDFGDMSETCQNALLKFIEEPQEYNRFVMAAQNTSKILSTVISRVVTIALGENEGDADCSAEVTEVVKAAVDALARKSEYDVAAAFARLKDRQSFYGALKLLMAEIHRSAIDTDSVLARSCGVRNIISASQVVSKYIKRMEYNPNVPIAAASCSAELTRQLTIDS